MESTEEIAPLTVKHQTSRASHQLISTSTPISLLSYPQIPSRRSSISASAGYASSSSGLATSTRTPSLDDSLYNIQVAKLRQDHATSKKDTQKTGVDTSETLFQEHVWGLFVALTYLRLTFLIETSTLCCSTRADDKERIPTGTTIARALELWVVQFLGAVPSIGVTINIFWQDG